MAPSRSLPDLPDFSKEVTIIINEEQPDLAASFHVPESFLTENSEFFQAACRGEWKEATSRIIKLPDVEPDVFSLYLFWVYRGKLAVCNEWDLDDENRYEHAHFVLTRLVKLWILADRLADMKLRNATIDEMIAATSEGMVFVFNLFTPELTNIVWSATTARRSLRRLLLDFHISNVWVKEIENSIDELHPDFVKDLMLVALKKVEDSDIDVATPASRETCYYHDHDDKILKRDCFQDG